VLAEQSSLSASSAAPVVHVQDWVPASKDPSLVAHVGMFLQRSPATVYVLFATQYLPAAQIGPVWPSAAHMHHVDVSSVFPSLLLQCEGAAHVPAVVLQ
jgi:hypothetical protein